MKDSATKYRRFHKGASAALACRAQKRLSRTKQAATGSDEVQQRQVPRFSLWNAKDKEILARAFEDFNATTHSSKNQKFKALQEVFVALGGDKSRSWRAVEGKTRKLWRAKQLVFERDDDFARWFKLSNSARRTVIAGKAVGKMLLLMSPEGLRTLDELVGNSSVCHLEADNAAIVLPKRVEHDSSSGTAVGEESFGEEATGVENSVVCQREVDNVATVRPTREPVRDNSMDGVTVGDEALDDQVDRDAIVPTPNEPIGEHSVDGMTDEEGQDDEAIEATATAPEKQPGLPVVDTPPATCNGVEEDISVDNPTREVRESEGGGARATLARKFVRELRITSREQRLAESAVGILMASVGEPQAKKRRLLHSVLCSQ
ncbi:hypothetical protein P3T76_003572 [Phytophthora citrophthora]|uniref:Uncharacterized protein n=1 Tax=Phytophthora citrophthora TaxID=4793 RepID=A0AAD9LSF5_9STRA|nr:hypothetical protein P3T76_003572 [Phytophthora citrophthora]